MIWGTDSVWYGSPQWQIEALRRLEIPRDLQEKYDFEPLGPADGPVKSAIFWDNGAKFYDLEKKPEYRSTVEADTLERIKKEFKKRDIGRSNAAYGYVNTHGLS